VTYGTGTSDGDSYWDCWVPNLLGERELHGEKLPYVEVGSKALNDGVEFPLVSRIESTVTSTGITNS